MPVWLDILLEIVSSILPALVVFLTVYLLLKQFFAAQQNARLLELQQNNKQIALPMRLQAYERLSLFCERITLPNLILRTRQPNMTASELRIALLVAIQQEYEHNVTQQVYVSEKLWDIIQLARDHAMHTITQAAEQISPREDGQKLADAVMKALSEAQMNPLQTAQNAIKKEASIYLG